MPLFEWKNLRSFKGSQQAAFEELCCQLALHEIPGDFKFIRKGTPDAGVECFGIAPDGSEWGWQAKFFEKLGTVQWRELDGSFITALEKHPRLVKYYVCIPIDLSDPRVDRGKSQFEKWTNIKQEWANRAIELGRTIDIEYWGNFEIFERLTSDKHKGRVYFWFKEEVFTSDWFQNHLDAAIDGAGPRYTAQLNVNLPISRIFDGLGRTPEFVNWVKLYLRDINKSFNWIRLDDRDSYSVEETSTITSLHTYLLSLLSQVTCSSIKEFPWKQLRELIEKFVDILDNVNNKLRELDRHEVQKMVKPGDDKNKAISYHRSKYYDQSYHVLMLSSDLQKLSEYLASKEVEASNKPMLLVTGEAGKGKTHLFCDVARIRVDKELPTILLLGEWFSNTEEPWSQILKLLDLRDTSVEHLLGALDAAAEANGQKALIMIDAINEGEGKRLWREHLARVITSVSKYPWLGLAVSVRSSYEKITVPDNLTKNEVLVRVIHQGFTDHEYDAVRSFFEYYGLELPSFPLLLPEFQTPLFLKILCKGLSDKGVRRLPSGYIGVTETFKLFTDAIDDKIWREHYSEIFHSPRKMVWKALETLAEAMISNHRDWLKVDEAEELVNKLVNGASQPLFPLLISEGAISTHMHYEKDQEFEVIRFSYEKFSDHIISNYLIIRHIQPENPQNAFTNGGALEYIISEPWRYQGIIESLCVQVPEKVGKEFPDIVGKASTTEFVGRGFISSIIWREPKSFTQKTKEWLTEISGRTRSSFEETTDALLSVSTNPHHPYNANFLHSILKKYPMADRDAWWSIYLHRDCGNHKAVDRIIDWAWSNHPKDYVSDEALELCGLTIGWFLASSNRFLRDRSTKALVSLLSNKLHLVENILEHFKDVDDLYIIERLYAVAYGCVLRSTDNQAIKSLAETVYRLIFAGNPPIHILIRDYARGVIECTLSRGINLDISIEKIKPPFRSEWPVIPSEEDIAAYDEITPYDSYDGRWSQGIIWFSVMQDDFARYIIGTNISMESRHWLSLRIGDNSWKSPKERHKEFVQSLNDDQKKAWENYRAIRQEVENTEVKIIRNLPDETLRHLISLSEKEQAKPDYEVEEEYLEVKNSLDHASQKINNAVTQFENSLTVEKRKIFVEFIFPYDNNQRNFNEYPRFKLEEMQRWILKRVFDLGWTVERFGVFDRFEIGHNGRDSHKAERIGKKYQWIAYHEFLAYLSDHYQFRHEYKEELTSFDGAWQLGVRDIDPSCTIKSSQSDDSFDPLPKSWWVPIDYEAWDLDKDEGAWLSNSKDLPDVTSLIEVFQPEQKLNWLCLDGFYRWDQPVPLEEDKYARSRRDLWLMLRCYLVDLDDIRSLSRWAVKQNFMGRWMTEPISLYDVFIGEYYWSKPYWDAFEGENGWIGGTKNSRVPKKVLVPVEEYNWEGSGYDCSVDKGIQITNPASFVSSQMKLAWNGIEGKYFDKTGELIAFDPSIFEDGPSVLLIRRDRFIDFLQEHNLGILWTVLGEKQLIGGNWGPKNWKGRLNLTGAYWLDGTALRGKVASSFER